MELTAPKLPLIAGMNGKSAQSFRVFAAQPVKKRHLLHAFDCALPAI
jgi:hypothetical protein